METRCMLAEVSWTGGMGNLLWPIPDNWSAYAVPTSDERQQIRDEVWREQRCVAPKRQTVCDVRIARLQLLKGESRIHAGIASGSLTSFTVTIARSIPKLGICVSIWLRIQRHR
jgi:hypothetical protein